MQAFRAPGWLPGGHLQTIWAARLSRRVAGAAPTWRRERWDTPDGDFIDVDFVDGPPGAPMLVLFHGLEGSRDSHYSQAFADAARAAGWAMALPHFRGCSGELNRAPRAYHSGDHEEVGWILGRLRTRVDRPLRAAGVSLGGNALMRWAEEMGAAAAPIVAAVAAICSPLDLTAAGHAIGRPVVNRQVYTRMFLSTMKPKALAKWHQHPGLFDRERMLAARTLAEFDDVFTAPLHGFRDTADYWLRASAKPHLRRVRIPALLLNACNDPFVPADSLPRPSEVAEGVTLWQPPHGGHVGFPVGRWPGFVGHMPARVLAWLAAQA